MFFKSFCKVAFGIPRPRGMKIPTPKIGSLPTPGNPVHDLKGLTGARATTPFSNPVNKFGTTARKGLVSRTSSIRGIKI